LSYASTLRPNKFTGIRDTGSTITQSQNPPGNAETPQ